MNNGKLVGILRSLSNQERKRLLLFLQSPYHNTKEELTTLYRTLDEQLFYLGISDPERRLIWSSSFPGKSYNEVSFRTLCSQLLKKVEEFVVDHSLNHKPEIRGQLLIDELDRRKLDKHLNYALQLSRKRLTAETRRDSEHFFNRYKLEIAQHRLNARQNFRSQKLAPADALESLDTFFLSNKLRFTCVILNLQHILHIDADIEIIDQLVEYLESSNRADDPAVAIYYSVLNMLREENPEPSYKRLRELIESTSHVLSKEEQYEVYVHAINFCIRQSNKGETSYLEELFDLYRYALDQKVLFLPEYMLPSDYKNIVTVGLRVGEYKWVRSFIGTFKKKLAPAFRENAYTYNLAKYYFNTEKYDQVLQLLQEVEYDDVFYNLDSKVMLLKIYYNQEETDALLSLFDSFSVYLRRNKILSSYHKTINLNLIRFVKRLVNIPGGQTDKLNQLADKIRSTKEITDINWLLAKVEEKRSSR